MSLAPDQGNTFAGRLVELGQWLEGHWALWAERPFVGLPVSWEASEPEVSAALRALPEAAIEAYESRPWALPNMPPAFESWARQARVRAELSPLPAALASESWTRPRKIPGRKWQQIARFMGVVLEHKPESVRRWLDWCAGKGHLGRSLAAATGLPVTCVEHSSTLCCSGSVLADAAGVEFRFVASDVLRGAVDRLDEELGSGTGVVALHACGRLHEVLIERSVEAGAEFIALAPCCYHRHQAGSYVPMSEAGRRAGLELDSSQLRLVGLNEVVASPRRQHLRRKEQAYRLGLDLLLRELTGEDRYRPLGPAPREWVDLTFEAFCRSMAQRASIELNEEGLDFGEHERLGWERLRITRALGMIRGLFRGPLETWLLLDRAQYLLERGWRVVLGTFCPPSVTPRNGMILSTAINWDGPTILAI